MSPTPSMPTSSVRYVLSREDDRQSVRFHGPSQRPGCSLEFVAAAQEALGPVEILVNAAGMVQTGTPAVGAPFDELTPEDLQRAANPHPASSQSAQPNMRL